MWQAAHEAPYSRVDSHDRETISVEAQPESSVRLARDCQRLDEARLDVKANRVVAQEDADAGLVYLASDERLPELSREGAPSSHASQSDIVLA